MKSIKNLISLIVIMFILSANYTTFANTDISQIIGDNNTVVFVDVPENYWAKNEIDNFSRQKIVEGNGDGTFLPDKKVSREEFCKLLVRTFNANVFEVEEPSFSDVGKNRWSYGYIETCKDFLSVYENPLGGKPVFKPGEYATREDIAVALVKMIGLENIDVDDYYSEYYNLRRNFTDYNSISYSLRKYVDIASAVGLITGYPDNTFRPHEGITKAETVVMLSRATKQAYSETTEEIKLNAETKYTNNGKTVNVIIKTVEGVDVTVNGEPVEMDYWGYGDEGVEGEYRYTFDKEGKHILKIVGKKGVKNKTIEIEVSYLTIAPILYVDTVPEQSLSDRIEISGTVTASNNEDVTIDINGKIISERDSNWSGYITLNGGENKLKITATTETGKTTSVEKTINYGPQITFVEMPKTTTKRHVNLSGFITPVDGSNLEDTVLKINGDKLVIESSENRYSSNKSEAWEHNVFLKPGKNIIEFLAIDSSGAKTVIKKEIYVEENINDDEEENFDENNSVKNEEAIVEKRSIPMLEIDDLEKQTEKNSIIVSGTVYDELDENPTIEINGKSVAVKNGKWSKKIELDIGENYIEIVATNMFERKRTTLITVERLIEKEKEEINLEETETTTEKKTNTEQDEYIENSITHKGSKYILIKEMMSWSEAKKHCENMGGHLVVITSHEENSIVAKLVDGGRYWIGGTDKNNEGNWEWVTGEKWEYTNWDESTAEPNGGDSENYAVTWGSSSAVWNDLSNDSWEQNGFICEIE